MYFKKSTSSKTGRTQVAKEMDRVLKVADSTNI